MTTTFMSMLAAFMNDEAYLHYGASEQEQEPGQAESLVLVQEKSNGEEKEDQFVEMLACFMNDERYRHYHP